MTTSNSLMSVGLPVRNGAERLERVVASVLDQDHENLELVICDNASTDGTEELCRQLAARDSRIVYVRNTMNVGILNNFMTALSVATGSLFRWVSDDDWLHPRCLSRSAEAFAADERLLLVTTQTKYTGPDGVIRTVPYQRTELESDDPVVRFAEMLRLQNESYLLLDPLFGFFRRELVMRIKRRNMMNEDQVFAAKLALAGPWGHVPEVLAWRSWKYERLPAVARKLGVPPWQAYCGTALQCRELLRWLETLDLDEQQMWRARRSVVSLYFRRHKMLANHRRQVLSAVGHRLAEPLRMRPSENQDPLTEDRRPLSRTRTLAENR